MPKSAKKNPQTEENVQKFQHDFLQIVADLSSTEEVATFMQDFFTDSEMNMFVKRFAVLLSLHQGESYQHIQKKYGVSSATVSTISEQREKKGVQLILKKMQTDRWAQQWAHRLAKFFPVTN